MKRMTFAEAANRYIAMHEPAWRNAKHAWQWRNSLDRYVIPKIGALDVGDVGINQVLDVLEPIWRTRTVTASRLRGRIELIISWADKRAERERLNPARWRGHLDTQLPRSSPSQPKPRHHAALPRLGDGQIHERSLFRERHRGTSIGVCHPHRRAFRRSALRHLVRNRLQVLHLDGTGRKDEERARASDSAESSGDVLA